MRMVVLDDGRNNSRIGGRVGGLAEQTGGEVLVRMKLCQLHSGKVRMERIGQELRVKIMEFCRSLE
jgi:hypothetical protein